MTRAAHMADLSGFITNLGGGALQVGQPNGNANGFRSTGGNSGNNNYGISGHAGAGAGSFGVFGSGGSTGAASCYGVYGQGGTGTNGFGVYGIGGPAAAGVYGVGGTNGHGLYGQGTGNGYGISAVSTGGPGGYFNTSGSGYSAVQGGPTAGTPGSTVIYGVRGDGNASGAGGYFVGGANGHGVTATGGSTSGYGVTGYAVTSVGVIGYSTNTSYYGICGYFASATHYSFYGNGVAYNTSAWTTSDRRLKESIQPIENALDIVNAFNPVTYKWKPGSAGYDGKIKYGLVSQDVLEVVPDMVFEVTPPALPVNPETGELSERNPILEDTLETHFAIDYNQVGPILLKAVQELYARLVALETGTAFPFNSNEWVQGIEARIRALEE